MAEPTATEVADESVARDLVITFGVAEGERAEIRQFAADYGARVGRPVSVAEYVRDAALQRLTSV